VDMAQTAKDRGTEVMSALGMTPPPPPAS